MKSEKPKTERRKAADKPKAKPQPASDANLLVALASENGLKGVRESQARLRVPLEHDALTALAQTLEEAGAIRILGFTPLHFIASGSLDFLSQKIVALISRHHAAQPEERGLALDKLRHRLDAPSQVLSLCVRLLVHEGTLREEGNSLALASFEHRLPPREEQLLAAFEERCRLGPGAVVSGDDVRADLHITPQKFESLASVLADRQRIVRTKEGYILLRPWLDDIVARIRASEKPELAVGAFKEMTGLSRKFAIPLLELLDEMGITRRTGASREIVRT
jgi:selenocysteine-specific elongation factor